MIGLNSKASTLSMVAALCILATAHAHADVPPRSDGGQTLVVPDDQLDLGEVYHATPGTGTQFIMTADAPFLRIAAVCNRVVGYVVAPFDLEEGQPPVLAGAFRIPLASLSTGGDQYDAEFRGPQAFNAAEFPEMTLRIKGVTDAKQVRDENGRKSYTMTLAAEFTARGTTVELEVPASVHMTPFTWRTMRVSLGDMLILRTRFELTPAQLGLPAPQDTDFSADSVAFDLYLACSTSSPELKLDPSVKRVHHVKQHQFLTLLRDFDDPERGYEYGRAFRQEIWDDAQALNRLAWAVLTEEGIKTRDLAFALRTVQRANALSEAKDPGVLNTLARAFFERGELELALKSARQAAEHLEGATREVAAEVQAALQRYEALAGTKQE